MKQNENRLPLVNVNGSKTLITAGIQVGVAFKVSWKFKMNSRPQIAGVEVNLGANFWTGLSKFTARNLAHTRGWSLCTYGLVYIFVCVCAHVCVATLSCKCHLALLGSAHVALEEVGDVSLLPCARVCAARGGCRSAPKVRHGYRSRRRTSSNFAHRVCKRNGNGFAPNASSRQKALLPLTFIRWRGAAS